MGASRGCKRRRREFRMGWLGRLGIPCAFQGCRSPGRRFIGPATGVQFFPARFRRSRPRPTAVEIPGTRSIVCRLKEKDTKMNGPARITALAVTLAGMVLSISGCNRLQARDQLNKGVDAYKSSHYEEAIDHFQKATELDPACPRRRATWPPRWLRTWCPDWIRRTT
jgi:hypothetical protein